MINEPDFNRKIDHVIQSRPEARELLEKMRQTVRDSNYDYSMIYLVEKFLDVVIKSPPGTDFSKMTSALDAAIQPSGKHNTIFAVVLAVLVIIMLLLAQL